MRLCRQGRQVGARLLTDKSGALLQSAPGVIASNIQRRV